MKRLGSDRLVGPEDACRLDMTFHIGREGGFADVGNPATLKAKLGHRAGYGGGNARNPER